MRPRDSSLPCYLILTDISFDHLLNVIMAGVGQRQLANLELMLVDLERLDL